MDTSYKSASSDDLSHSTNELEGGANAKVKVKRPGMLGKLKNRIFGSKKRRTRSNDSKGDNADGYDIGGGGSKAKYNSDSDAGHLQPPTNNTMSMSVDSIFTSNEDMSGINNRRNTPVSSSMEVLTSGSKLKSELERKLMNRRSFDDDGLPGSPIGTPTTADILSHTNFMSQDLYRIDRDSDGSLLSIGSSENEEDAFFKNPWKGAHTSAIRRPRRSAPSSDSESDGDALDFDAVSTTGNLSHIAAMHKRNVRPKHRVKSRRVIAAPTQMPSVAEKKTLEIAHTFLDEGERTAAVKIRGNIEQSSSLTTVTVRRTDSGKPFSSPSGQRKSDPSVINEGLSKSPKPLARSATTTSRKTGNEDQQEAHHNELLSIFQKFKPPQAAPDTKTEEAKYTDNTTPQIAIDSSATNTKDEEPPPPPRPAKTVVFSGTPPLQKRNKAPAVQPRPKSMFPQQARSKTQEIQGSNVEEALSNLSYSKSFNIPDSTISNGGFLGEKVNMNEKAQATPDWVKLAKRKTWAVTDEVDQPKSTTEAMSTSVHTPRPASKPVPAPRGRGLKPDSGSGDRPTSFYSPADQHMREPTNELQARLSQVYVRSGSTDSNGAYDSSTRSTPSPLDNERPLLYGPSSPGLQPTRSDKGPALSSSRKSSYDNVALGAGTYSYYSDKLSPSDESKSAKETIVSPKSKPVPASMSMSATEYSKNSDQLTVLAEPPWKVSLRQKTGSLKANSSSSSEDRMLASPTPAPKPAWKSATLKERTTPMSLMTSSTEFPKDALSNQMKSRTIELPARRPNPMTVSESSAYRKDSPEGDLDGQEARSVKDRLKMFQKK